MVELTWDGKYDKDGKRAAPLRIALPFQTVETVNESAQQRQRMLDIFAAGRDPEWRNRLIWGDKKYVLPSLLPELAGKVDLIYIDPPFATGADFSYQAQVGDDEFIKEANMIEEKAYRDTWGQGLNSYVSWFYETASLLYELLSEEGSIYVHCDPTASHYIKVIMDAVFGRENFRNEVIWQRIKGAGKITQHKKRTFGPATDTILFYTRSNNTTFNIDGVLMPYSEHYMKTHFKYRDSKGRYGRRSPFNSPGQGARPNQCYEYKGFYPPHPSGWNVTLPTLEKMDADGDLEFADGRVYRKQRPRDGIMPNSLWLDINAAAGKERLGYPTQKSEDLLDRIIRVSSNEGDLVLDCFCGSGTTAAVAEKLNRRWIACDLGRFAIHTARKRLLGIENVRPFVVQNLGKYERQVWQKAEFGENMGFVLRAYRQFILDLYHAETVEGCSWLHGVKGRRMVHVGSVDSPIALGDVQQIAIEFKKTVGKNPSRVAGVDVLGWDFALDMNETARQIAQDAGLQVRFMRIPREVLEKKAVDQGDIQFFELAALSVEKDVKGRQIDIELTDFMVPPDDVPDDVIKVVHHWSEWIDYWAVDFDYRADAFHNQWQSYRTRKDRRLLLRVSHDYPQAGDYVVLVKVIDILGNDTTKAIPVKVR